MQVITFSDFVILYLERNYLDKFCDCVVGKMRGTYEKYYKNNISDTGSLALGGFVAGTAYVMQMPLFILIVGLIYLIEVLSVIIQVTYFKATHGKRIFKMAPIHHHFELCGWSETRVVAVFSVITAVMCMVALLAL